MIASRPSLRVAGKLRKAQGGFIGVSVFPYLLHWKVLLGAESAVALASAAGLIVTLALVPETKGRRLEAI